MKTDLSPDTDVSLLPRADLPVIWDAFKAKAEAVRATAETLTVTCVTQKDEMALARTTRLTLREIRIAVENKRVELGESHLKEIKKVNGAANAIREFIQPLEARLLVQEEFAERTEERRVTNLSVSRGLEVMALWPGIFLRKGLGKMPQAEYDEYLGALRKEREELETANRLRIEAERKLAEQAIEMRRQEEAFLEKLQAEKVAENARLAEAQAEQDRQHTIAKEKSDAYQAELRAEWERQQTEKAAHQATLDAAKAIRDADLAEQKRVRDIQYAKLEAELNEERAVKQAEAKRVMELALAPDVEKLWSFAGLLRVIKIPMMDTPAGGSYAVGIHSEIQSLALDIETTCKSWGLTKV